VRASGLAVTHCIPAVSTILPLAGRPGPAEPEARVEAICASVRRLAALGASSMLFITGPADRDGARRIVVDGIAAIGEAAARAGLRVGLEPIHPSGTTHSFVHTIPDALALVDEAGAAASVGVFVDTWNLGDAPGVYDDLRRSRDRVVGVHLADRRSPTRSFYDRALPGEGTIPLRPFLEALDWDGWADVEIFSDESFEDSLWRLPPEQAARRAVAAHAAAFAA
jgi:sugar phosphate isomerase/epimerase